MFEENKDSTYERMTPAAAHCPVLIVEDDADLREMMAQLLTLEGYETATVANGREALEYLHRAVAPQVILLDLMMPIMDGYGFLDERRGDPALASIPIAIVTAGHGVDRARLGHDLPIVRKPFDIPDLLRVLQTLTLGGGSPVDA
jgi:CheY-like chemotaxis protein